MTDDTPPIHLYRCVQLKAWLTLDQCDRNHEQHQKEMHSRKKPPEIEGIMSCRGCPGRARLCQAERKEVSRVRRAGPYPERGKKKNIKRRPNARALLGHTMKQRLYRKNTETGSG